MNDLSAKEERLSPGLYLVATPIGNLADMTLRAISILKSCDKILCEDTRVTGRLLSFYDIKKPMMIFNDHTGDQYPEKIIALLKSGKALALVSDAGMPLISDPGFKLVRAARANGIQVTTAPGANAVLSALQLSALPSDRFIFLGFTPPKAAARRSFWHEVQDISATLVAYETAPRLVASLKDALSVLGNRKASVVREITKMFEETKTGDLEELVSYYTAKGDPKGEIVIVIEGAGGQGIDIDLEALLKDMMKKMSLKEAVAQVAAQTGISRKIVYSKALSITRE